MPSETSRLRQQKNLERREKQLAWEKEAAAREPRVKRLDRNFQLQKHAKEHAPVELVRLPDGSIEDVPHWLPHGWESPRRPADSGLSFVLEWFRNEIAMIRSPAHEEVTDGKDYYSQVADGYRLAEAFQLRCPIYELPKKTWKTFEVDEKGKEAAISELEKFQAYIWSLETFLVSSDMADLAAPLPEPEMHFESGPANTEVCPEKPAFQKRIETPPKTKKRTCYDRDHAWLKWYETEGEEGYKSPAKIRDRWNNENPKNTISHGSHGIDTVKKGIKNAKKEQGKLSK